MRFEFDDWSMPLDLEELCEEENTSLFLPVKHEVEEVKFVSLEEFIKEKD